MDDMSIKYHYYLSTFDDMTHDWELGLRYNDGSVINPEFYDKTETEIIGICKKMLDEESNLVRIFIWCGDHWYGEVCR